MKGAGEYFHILVGPVQPGACYGTTLHVIGDPPGYWNDRDETWTGTTRCAPEDDDLPDKDLPDDGSGDPATPPGGVSPILIDLDDDGFLLGGLSAAGI